MLTPFSKLSVLGILMILKTLLVASLALATGMYPTRKRSGSRYTPHQGKQEMARRRRQMQAI